MPNESTPSRLDEHLLAALLSGTLPEPERELVLARLASDLEARIVLQMAMEALEAAESHTRKDESRPDTKRRAA